MFQMKILYLDTSDSSNISAKIEIDGNAYEEVSTPKTQRPESVLLLIDKLLGKIGLDPKDIDEIKVKRGPGSYTGLKVGVSVANALSFALQKEVNSKPLGSMEDPRYN